MSIWEKCDNKLLNTNLDCSSKSDSNDQLTSGTSTSKTRKSKSSLKCSLSQDQNNASKKDMIALFHLLLPLAI